MALLLLGCEKSAPAFPEDYGRTPVLLVHGLGENSNVWTPLRISLERAGYPAAYVAAVNLEPSDGANAPAAETQLAPAVDSLLARARQAAARAGAPSPVRVDLVAHSMGALSSRYYTALLHPELVRRWISLAGSNHGSNRFCPSSGPASHDLCPAFAALGIQERLNGTGAAPRDESPFGIGEDGHAAARVPPDSARRIGYFSLHADREEWIVPDSSTALDGTGGTPVSIDDLKRVTRRRDGDYLVTGTDHDKLIRDRQALQLITRLLSAPD